MPRCHLAECSFRAKKGNPKRLFKREASAHHFAEHSCHRRFGERAGPFRGETAKHTALSLRIVKRGDPSRTLYLRHRERDARALIQKAQDRVVDGIDTIATREKFRGKRWALFQVKARFSVSTMRAGVYHSARESDVPLCICCAGRDWLGRLRDCGKYSRKNCLGKRIGTEEELSGLRRRNLRHLQHASQDVVEVDFIPF